MNDSSGPLSPGGAARLSAGHASPPPTSASEEAGGRPSPGADSAGYERVIGLPVFGVLLGDFLASMGRIETDFTMRWNAARLGAPISERQRVVPQAELWPYA